MIVEMAAGVMATWVLDRMLNALSDAAEKTISDWLSEMFENFTKNSPKAKELLNEITNRPSDQNNEIKKQELQKELKNFLNDHPEYMETLTTHYNSIEDRYLRRVIEDCRQLGWTVQVENQDRQAPRMSLETVYTPLLTTTPIEKNRSKGSTHEMAY